jgi:hypothetical protein
MKFSLEGARDLQDLIRQLSLGLSKLNIEENMEAFKVENLEIAANTEVSVRNKLTFIPKQYIITSQEGNGLVTKGPTAWDVNNLYLKNNDASNAVTLTIIFMR